MERLHAIDRVRGLAVLLMVTDHAAHVFYRDARSFDTALFRGWDQALPTVPFLHRWLSHFCAPAFVFLAGTAVVLAAARRAGGSTFNGVAARDVDPGIVRRFDRDLALRGLLLIAIDLTLISFFWGPLVESRFLLQVLFALGVGLVALVPLRRLGARAACALGLALIVGNEALGAWTGGSAFGRAAFAAGPAGDALVLYPALPWLGVMLLGAAYGGWLVAGRDALRPLWLGSLVAFATWVAVEVGDGYGNGGLTGVHDSWLRWLQTSKYPPSLGFLGLELGLVFGCLAAFTVAERRRPTSVNAPLVVLGQTALFFYVAHIALIEGVGHAARAMGVDLRGGLGRNTLAVLITVGLLLPLCRWFRALRRRHSASLLRLV